jgi:hypothetical protein
VLVEFVNGWLVEVGNEEVIVVLVLNAVENPELARVVDAELVEAEREVVDAEDVVLSRDVDAEVRVLDELVLTVVELVVVGRVEVELEELVELEVELTALELDDVDNDELLDDEDDNEEDVELVVKEEELVVLEVELSTLELELGGTDELALEEDELEEIVDDDEGVTVYTTSYAVVVVTYSVSTEAEVTTPTQGLVVNCWTANTLAGAGTAVTGPFCKKHS